MAKSRVIIPIVATVALIGGFLMYLLYSDAQKQQEEGRRRQAHIQDQISLLDKEREASILLQKEREARFAKFLAESEKLQDKPLAISPARPTAGIDIKNAYQDFAGCIHSERIKYQRPRNQQDHLACTVDYTYGTIGYESCVNKRRGGHATELALQSCEPFQSGKGKGHIPDVRQQHHLRQGKSVMIIKAEPH